MAQMQFAKLRELNTGDQEDSNSESGSEPNSDFHSNDSAVSERPAKPGVAPNVLASLDNDTTPAKVSDIDTCSSVSAPVTMLPGLSTTATEMITDSSTSVGASLIVKLDRREILKAQEAAVSTRKDEQPSSDDQSETGSWESVEKEKEAP
eukprot:GHVR01180728.1.p1 GENE.GHVR01180728.1~~GHVR01180728.1.p1  ORF type:complete len:150 (-),score=13.48 GHVR01180728.1:319-768(-)